MLYSLAIESIDELYLYGLRTYIYIDTFLKYGWEQVGHDWQKVWEECTTQYLNNQTEHDLSLVLPSDVSVPNCSNCDNHPVDTGDENV